MACPCWRFCVDDCPFPKEGIFLCVDNMYILIKLYIYICIIKYILYYVMLCFVVLYSIIVYCIILNCIRLYCIMRCLIFIGGVSHLL